MSSKSFLLKEITFEETIKTGNTNSTFIRVSRTHNSDGGEVIFLKIGDNKRIEFSNDVDKHGKEFETVTGAVIKLLQQALDNKCLLPK